MSEFSKFEEENIILLALESPEFFHRIASFMKPEYFDKNELGYIMALYLDYYQKYDSTPTREAIVNLAYKDLSVDDELSRPVMEILRKELDPRNAPFIKDLIINWARKKQISMLYNPDVMEKASQGDYDDIQKIFDDAMKISDVIIKPFRFFDDIDQLFVDEERDYFTTGFARLDKEFHNKGPARREIFAWVAPTGVGKCHTLDSKIIEKTLSKIYELKLEDGTIRKIAGFRKVQVKNDEIMICDLTKEHDIISLPDQDDEGDIYVNNIMYREIEFGLLENRKNAEVLGYKNQWKKVKWFSKICTDQSIIIITKFGKLVCHCNHRILTNNGEKFAHQLNNDDKLMGYNDELVSFQMENGKVEDFYDIEIDGPHWYYTSGIVSHNSICLVNTSVVNYMQGKNVLHVSLENDERVTGHRYLGAFTDIPIASRSINKDKMKKRLVKIKHSSKSELYVIYFPTDTVSVDAVEVAVKDLDRQYGFKPDVLVLDYLECLLSKNPHKNRDDYSRQKAVAAEFRALSAKMNVFGATASQSNRSSVASDSSRQTDAAPINLDKLAESYGKAMPMDYVVSINQNMREYQGNEELPNVGRFRFYIAKNRNGKKNVTVNATVNYSTMRVREDDLPS